jgi:FMN phosphatase YigB (HAD superfamily)
VEQFYKQAKKEHYEMYPFKPERHNKWLRLRLFLDKIQKNNGLKFAPNFLDKLHKFYWDYFVAHAKPYPDTRKTLEELMQKSIVVIATNNEDKETELKMKLFGLEAGKHYRYLFSSEQLGVCKPAPEFLEKLLQRLEESLGQPVSRKKVFVVGDDPSKDFAWAKSIGATTIRIRKDLHANREPRSPDEKPDYTVNNLSEILDII